MRKYLLPVLLLLPISAQAQETKVHPIDKFFESCTDKNPSTAGMVDCTSRAYKMWDQPRIHEDTQIFRVISWIKFFQPIKT
ncbi:MAG TPA: hypothetical protein VE135_10795 [Pyrinomonadaceae bacterium]|nr:hypothetical protein [Pyrinomonadaceae bacterium]